MTRKEVMTFLEGQLKKLQEAHVADLMRARRSKELEQVLEDMGLEFSPIESFFNETNDAIYQDEEEIPKQFCYELGLYMQQSHLADTIFFEDYEVYRTILKEMEERLALEMATRMIRKNLSEYTIEKLLSSIMTREEVKQFLEEQLNKLPSHVIDLMRNRQYEELEKLLEDIEWNFFPIQEFSELNNESIYQSKTEIPKEFCYKLALYMQQSPLSDDIFFDDYRDYQTLLIELEEELADKIADVMNKDDLCECTVEELLG